MQTKDHVAKAFLTSIALFFVGCDYSGPELNMKQQADLEARAKTLPLKERYALHEKVFRIRKPPYEFLAPVVAASGPTAYELAVSKAKFGDLEAVYAAFSVIRAYTSQNSVQCYNTDYEAMRKHVQSLSANVDLTRAIEGQLGIACNLP